MFTGHEVNTGVSISVTVTVNEHTLVFPFASVAVNETLVTPIGNVDPLEGPRVWMSVAPAQLSEADGAGQLTTAPHTPGLLLVEILIGQEVNTGNSLSVTFTLNEQVAVFPPASVAV
jgi:hypothetical protein